jgi:REP element-mobilizing transposase RayT
MPQSLACVPIHFIFSTKNRVEFLSDDLREELHAYMATVLQKGVPFDERYVWD